MAGIPLKRLKPRARCEMVHKIGRLRDQVVWFIWQIYLAFARCVCGVSELCLISPLFLLSLCKFCSAMDLTVSDNIITT